MRHYALQVCRAYTWGMPKDKSPSAPAKRLASSGRLVKQPYQTTDKTVQPKDGVTIRFVKTRRRSTQVNGARVTVVRVGRLPQAQERIGFLIDTLGSSTQLAELLNVSRGQPGKWRSGAESPSAETSTFLVDLDHVLARATMQWGREVAKRWLVGTEPFLGGARPIDVLRQRGTRDVIEALDATMAGSFA